MLLARHAVNACLFFVVSSSLALAQQIIHVPADQPTIQAGIDAASNGDTVLVAPGTYSENIDFKGKNITVTSGATSYSVAANTTIQGSSGPTVSVQSGETSAAVLNGFTITHVGAGGTNSTLGDGVYLSGSSPVLSNNVITSNQGCGIAATNSSGPLIEGNDILGTVVASCGDQVELEPGAGISVFNGANVQILGNTIENNSAEDCGGGIYVEQAVAALLQNNIVRSNQARCDAAIFLREIQDLKLIQNLVYGNEALPVDNVSGPGAGIYIDTYDTSDPSADSLTIVDNTVYGNMLLQAGINQVVNGEQLYINYLPSKSIIENNIFASTDGALEVYCVYSDEYNFAYNDVYNTHYSGAQNCSPDGAGNISADPLFISVAGGNFHLPANSPAVAAGNVAAPSLPATDLDGLSRTYNGTVDMGVYEYHPPTQDTLSLTSSANPSYVRPRSPPRRQAARSAAPSISTMGPPTSAPSPSARPAWPFSIQPRLPLALMGSRPLTAVTPVSFPAPRTP
jgi:parallel beta-helix repeat protein